MPKGGCSKTPQPEDFSLSNDMVEKQTGKKVACLVLLPSCSATALEPDILKPWQCFMGQEVAKGCDPQSQTCVGTACRWALLYPLVAATDPARLSSGAGARFGRPSSASPVRFEGFLQSAAEGASVAAIS